MLLGLIAFGRTRSFEFLAIDDAMHTEKNPYITPFSAENLKRFWNEPYENAFTPLTYTLWMVQAVFAKLPEDLALQKKEFLFPEGQRFDAGVFHVANVLTHTVAVLAVYLVLCELFCSSLVALFGSCVFLLHPLQVEPVSWITGFRDVLAGALGFLTLYAYLRYCRSKKHAPILYGLATLLFLLATLAKSSSLSIIPMVVGIGILIEKRPWKRCLVEVVPWMVLVGPLFNVFSVLNNSVALRVVHIAPLPERILLALDAVAFYLWKSVWPLSLTMDYGRTPTAVIATGMHYATWFVPCLIGLASIFLWLKKKNPWPLLSFLIFFAGLIPVLGIKPFIFQHISTVADRYVYFSLLGFSILLCSFKNHWRWGAFYLAALFALTWKQLPVWKNNESLFSQVIQKNPVSWLALNDLGTTYEGSGKYHEAYLLYRRAAEISDIASAWNNAGAMALESKNPAAAIECFSHALRGSGFSAWAYQNLAVAHSANGDFAAASEAIEQAKNRHPVFNHSPRQIRELALDIRKNIVRKFEPNKKS